MRPAAVKSADNLVLESVCFSGVCRLNHTLRQPSQLIRTELAVARCFARKLNHLRSFFLWQPLDFFDDLDRCHKISLLGRVASRKMEPGPGTQYLSPIIHVLRSGQ